jgi:uncharacterized membrane protein YcaP (DUF421 family)
MTHRKDAKTWLKIGLGVFLAVVIIAYSAFQARKIVEGPELTLTSPLATSVQTDPLVHVTGIASNIKEIKLNGNPIYIDEKGNFNEQLLLSSGYNIIELEAKDKFNKETKKTIELVYKG